jgi:hypothetical protein
MRALQDEVWDPHGEERGKAARLEPWIYGRKFSQSEYVEFTRNLVHSIGRVL